MFPGWRKALDLAVLLIAGCALAGPTLGAEASKPFYEGKTVRLVVGYSPGGGFDTWSRLIARHISRHIPGHPSIIVQNMPGAGSLVAANRVFAMPERDGLTMVNFNGAVAVSGIVGIQGVNFDPEKYVWVGSPTPGFQPQVLYVRPQVAKTLDQLLRASEPVNLGATARGNNTYILSKFLEISGANVRVVAGYPGTNDVYAAIERGEVDGIFSSQESADTVFKRFSDAGVVVPLLKFGADNAGLGRLDIPDFADLAKKLRLSADNEALGQFIITALDLARMYALPPQTAPERIETLREAFRATVEDPKFLKEATKAGYVVDPLTASDIEQRVAAMIKTPKSAKELYKKLLQ